MLWIFKLFIQDSETVAQSQSEEVDLCKINALLEDEVEVQENEEDDDEADEDIVEEDEDVQEFAPAVEEESEVQEVVDLDTYVFRYCTCAILDPVTDRMPLDAAKYAVREARRRYATRHNQRVREARELARAQARVTPRRSPRLYLP